MLVNDATSAVQPAPAIAGLTAFQVAVVQAKVFEEKLEEVSEQRQEEAKAIKERKTAEESQTARASQAKGRGGVDFVVDGSQEPGGSLSSEKAEISLKGREVDIEV